MKPHDKILALPRWKRPIAWALVAIAAPIVGLWLCAREARRGFVWATRFPASARALRVALKGRT